MIKPLHLIILISVLSIGLIGCSPIVRPEQFYTGQSLSLGDGNPVGQTFTARYRGLSGVEVYVKAGQADAADLNLALFSDPHRQQAVAKSSLPAGEISGPGYYRFAFIPLTNSANQDYYLEISAPGDNRLEIGAGPADSYLDGAMYQANLPQEGQMAFRLAYDPYQLALGLGLLLLSWLGILAAGAFLFILPGWAILAWWEPDWKSRTYAERLALSAGVSLVVYPILFLWTDVIKLHLGPAYAWLPPLAAAAAIIWRNRQWRPKFPAGEGLAGARDWLASIHPGNYAYLFLVMLIFITRFWVIRNLTVPLWGDSYHHALIAQLLVDNGGLFNSWQPYAEIQTFTYHFGFHSLVAVFHWLTRLPLPQATLWTGQILNSLALVALYPLAVKIGRSRWSGILVILFAGLLSPMPMYYLNWGRYTQLAGQVILPVAVLLLWRLFELEHRHWGLVGLGWILMAGLALTHYRVLVFAMIFLVALFLFSTSAKGEPRRFLQRTSLAAIGALSIFLPWLVHVFGGKIYQALLAQVTTPARELSEFSVQYNAIGDLFFYLPAIFWVLLPFAAGWALWRRHNDIAIISAWWLLIFLAANPQWFRLPGSGTLSNFAVFMAAYIPASIILACGLVWLGEVLLSGVAAATGAGRRPGLLTRTFVPLLILIFIATGLAGARQRVKDLNLGHHALVTHADLRASAWIRQNLPREARFLVNSFFAYGDSLVVGSDAGWWLPLLSSRSTSLPPINYASEVGPGENYLQSVNKLVAEVQNNGPDDPAVLRLLKRRNISHIFIGQRRGGVNTSQPLLDLDTIQDSQHFRLVYNQDRVRIFEILN